MLAALSDLSFSQRRDLRERNFRLDRE